MDDYQMDGIKEKNEDKDSTTLKYLISSINNKESNIENTPHNLLDCEITGINGTLDNKVYTVPNNFTLQSCQENISKELLYQDDIIIEKCGSSSEYDNKDRLEEISLESNLNKNEQDAENNRSNRKKLRDLEHALNQAEHKSSCLQNQLDESIRKVTEANIAMKSELLGKIETLTKQYEMADKDKQSMVIKYANSEKEVIIVNKQLNKFEKLLKDANKDKETLQRNNRCLMQENTKKSYAFDKKVQEFGQLSRQNDKMKEEINAREIKSKWREHKLQVEIDAHKETQMKLDRKLNHRKTHEDEMAFVKREAAQLVERTKADELSRANVLDKLYNEGKAKFIMLEQKYTDINSAYYAVSAEFKVLKDVYSTQEDELSILRKKVMVYESEREESEKLVTSLQAEITSSKMNETNLSKLVSSSSGLSEQLEELKKEYILSCDTVNDLRENLNERESELFQNQKHENELLEFTKKISDKDAILQSQLSATKSKVEEVQSANSQLKQDFDRFKNESECLLKQLSELRNSKESEVKKLKEDYELLNTENSKLKTLASDMKIELTIQQRKFQNIVKDSGREVMKLKRKLELFEAKQLTQEGDYEENASCDSEPISLWHATLPHEPLSRGSNTSSTTSLNNIDGPNCTAPIKNYNFEEPLSNQIFVEKYLKLQDKLYKKEEKIEFFEGHTTQLLEELKRKNKILHHYYLKEEPGALSNCKSDDAKAQIIKKGGIMASIYGSSPKDVSMTLDLSLEINKKLQAVLEDTLLKNITLKENLNTLADEISTLTKKKLYA